MMHASQDAGPRTRNLRLFISDLMCARTTIAFYYNHDTGRIEEPRGRVRGLRLLTWPIHTDTTGENFSTVGGFK